MNCNATLLAVISVAVNVTVYQPSAISVTALDVEAKAPPSFEITLATVKPVLSAPVVESVMGKSITAEAPFFRFEVMPTVVAALTAVVTDVFMVAVRSPAVGALVRLVTVETAPLLVVIAPLDTIAVAAMSLKPVIFVVLASVSKVVVASIS